jgi:hypothetical protein
MTPLSHPTSPNRLIHETSLYLRQHAHNPVDWYPWGAEAFQQAQQHDKPILLSIGYSACHWCHVMAHESFESPTSAALMNRAFVNIKVDREERPDLDALYMNAVVSMTGQGGWPMTVFLFPDGTPFYGGTYFPPDEKAAIYGMISFNQVLSTIAEAYQSQREQLRSAGHNLIEHMRQFQDEMAGSAVSSLASLTPEVLKTAAARLKHDYDPHHGGFGNAPKFPQPMILEFLLRYAARTGDSESRTMLEHTLHAMANGGIYDQLGGGFHRYSVDERWLVPHFEKMLYDNALLARIYTEMFQMSQEPFYRRIAEETLSYMVREMHHPRGGFYSTQDADTEGKEGAFFVWSIEEIQAVLGNDAPLFCELYGITARGNFEGENILHLPRSFEEAVQATSKSEEDVAAVAKRSRETLWNRREQRVRPGRDEKVLTAWNGMALRAFAVAAAAFERADYLNIARRNADFLLHNLRRADGRVLRSWADLPEQANVPQTPGYLEDYALLADGLLALYMVDGSARWLEETLVLADEMLALFWDDEVGGFYDTAHDHEHLVLRPRDVTDNATPSGNSVAVEVLLRLAALTGSETYRARAGQVLTTLSPSFPRIPTAFGRLLCAADFALARVREVVLAGDRDTADMQALMQVVLRAYRPYVVVAYTSGEEQTEHLRLPLLQGRTTIEGRAAAYVCEQFTCSLPVTDAVDLRQQLAE